MAVRLIDPPEVARKKIMRAVTDTGRDISFNDDPSRAGVNNLLVIYEGFTGESRAGIESRFAGRGYGDLKKAVAEAVIAGLSPIQARYAELRREDRYLDQMLAQGAEQAAAVADETMRLVRERVGLLPPLSVVKSSS